MANYADGLCDLRLNEYVGAFVKKNKIASFISVRPTTTFHIVDVEDDGMVRRVEELEHSGIRMNGGFFIFRQQIFDYIKEGDEIVNEPFARLIGEEQLVSHQYDGFWLSMDNFKDKQVLDELHSRGNAPWQVWTRDG